ncbi:DUF2946 family protein [Ideonella livida]|uniref:DUF2946 family protein n=1 Tax=Ideonella livida TaxID=2707176 RepID=A0A7C9TMC7_9BURK|nr:DUF2946 family protein [Ideonella livida]NDY93858.1 DUF2946 family protein [Ideonella livida]
MDEMVLAALKKWPDVPACRGWLALDGRGDWYMRDDAVQRAGPFPQSRGSPVRHDKLIAFIGRNYAADAQGAWYFQNGPQRVYVELEVAPWIWRVQAVPGGGWAVDSHTGLSAHYQQAWLDEQGRLFLATDLGFGLVHSLDMDAAADAVDAGAWVCQTLPFAQMPARFGYRLSPAATGA